MTRLLAAVALAAALLAPPAGAAPASTAADYEIRFWETRLDRDPADALPPSKLGAAYLQKARESGDFSYYLKAEKALEKALQRSPQHVATLASLAAAKAAQHRFREAIALAEQATVLQPDDAYSHGILGDALLEAGETERARGVYAKLLRLSPGLFSYSRMANLRSLEGDMPGAVQYLQKAVEAGRRNGMPKESLAWCYVQMGEMHWSSGDWKTAEKHYQSALAITPEGYLPLEHLAELRAAQGRHPEALRLYEKVIARAPHPDFYEAVGDIHAALGRPAEAKKWHGRAREAYLKAVEQGNIGYYRHLAHFYADIERNPKEAIRWAEKDLEVRKDAHAYDTLAWARYRAGDYPGAAEAMRKALALGAKDAELFFHAALIHTRLGKKPEARRQLQQSLAANPRAEHAPEARRLLRALKASTVTQR